MITIRQLERHWLAKQYDQICRLCLEMRPEASVRLVCHLSRPAPAAALALIRLDELSQSHTPFAAKMLRSLLSCQESDGGFGDLLSTALAIRAMLCSQGQGPAVERAVCWVAALQKADGLWPAIPIRRMAADAFTTAFILYQLFDHPALPPTTIDFISPLDWLHAHSDELDLETARLWSILALKLPEPELVN